MVSNDTTHTITITCEITEQFLMDCLTTAVESGIMHDWEGFSWVMPEGCVRDTDLNVLRINFTAEPDDKEEVFSVGTQAVLATLRKMLEAGADYGIADYIMGYIRDGVREADAGCIDAEAADVIVQVAAFGKVVFG